MPEKNSTFSKPKMPNTLKDAKILIVDDNSANLLATEYMLLHTGYKIFKAKNGKECLDIVNMNTPDLILLDVNLPDINGMEICSAIKENEDTRHIYIIMMSGLFTDSDNQALGLETGADGYMTRPFQKRELQARISSLLRLKIAEDKLRNALKEKNESEELLKKYKEHLEELVSSRTSELEKANRRLKKEIKEHKKAKESIENQFIFLKALIDSIPNPVIFRNNNKIMTLYNKMFEETFDVQKILENPDAINDSMEPELKKELLQSDDELLRSPSTEEMEIRAKDKFENPRDYILRRTSFLNRNGEIAGILSVATEISYLKALEVQLKEALLKEREVNEFQAKFISTVSHEFRTPLTSILGAADLLEMFGDKWDRKKFNEYVLRIQKAAGYMTELINDLLTIRKAESGSMPVNLTKINLNKLCYEIVELMNSKFEVTHSIILNYKMERAYITQDEKLLKMILLNLLSNAIKYSPDGGEIIFDVDIKKGFLLFKIKDKGIGIAEEDKGKLFEPFFRGTNAGKIPGTGLGLSIVKKSVELCGGRIELKSKIEKGTSITVLIPY